MNRFKLNALDKVEIINLEDNFIERLSADNTDIVSRANAGKDAAKSVLAEHGFSTIIDTSVNNKARRMIFDFGLSRDIAARNADTMNIDLTLIEIAGLSHGHVDHVGGVEEVARKIGKNGLELVAHPAAFRSTRYRKNADGSKIKLPSLERKKAIEIGLKITETKTPYSILDGDILFLGEIPRKSGFEKGMPNIFYEEDGKEIHDTVEDDTSVVMNLTGKGLIIISGCAHAGIINTVEYAREVTGINKVHAILGGFHLCGPHFESIINETVQYIKKIEPDFIIPTHCTGMKAISAFEAKMPNQFIRNMSGTKLTFAS